MSLRAVFHVPHAVRSVGSKASVTVACLVQSVTTWEAHHMYLHKIVDSAKLRKISKIT